jgi:hypothetical protein
MAEAGLASSRGGGEAITAGWSRRDKLSTANV